MRSGGNAEICSAVKKLVQGVRHSYRAMMDELDWLDEGSRAEALAKIGNLQVNLGWPDWILENTALDAYYTPLAFADDGQDSFFAQLDKLQVNECSKMAFSTKNEKKENDVLFLSMH